MEQVFSERFNTVYNKYILLVEEIGSRPSEAGLARFLDVSQTTMQRWKKGQIPAAKDIKTIHDKLGFSYDWLISGEGEMFDDAAQKLAEKDAEIARLRTRLLIDGVTDEKSVTDTANASGQE